ncbi:MAG: hypothetical protein IPM64_08635 [Phycisphaerales bacterium]|nr:hypothetical protein [Phycisphaerales bacterium]
MPVRGVIRSTSPAARSPFSFANLEQQAGELLRRAQEQADALLAGAREEAARIAESARREARERGMAEARQAALAQVRDEALAAAREEARGHLYDLAGCLARAIDGFDRSRSALLAAAERDVIRLALAIAARICRITAGRESAVAIENARALLALARHEHDLVLCVSSADHARLETELPELLREVSTRAHVTLSTDDALVPGDCRLTGRDGTIDASLSVQLDNVAAALCPDAPSLEPPPGEAAEASAQPICPSIDSTADEPPRAAGGAS